MPDIRRTSFVLLALVVLSLGLSSSAWAQPGPTVSISGPVGPALEGMGQGMCMASAIVQRDPNTGRLEINFGTLDDSNYNATLNSFMETNQSRRVEYVVRNPLDLSNNNLADPQDQTSLGDFRNADPACDSGGCDFFLRDTSTSFVARLRGYLNVTDELVGETVHLGIYTDDAASITFFDKDSGIYQVMTRPPEIGAPTWRLTQSVRFEQAGLYPMEVLYAAITEHAALEIAYFVGSFQDFEREATQEPVVQLDDAGFTLFAQAQFFQAVSGSSVFPDPDQCEQCNRQFAGLPNNNGCAGGYYCNEAALCAPCDTALYCGPSCSPCGGTTPFCINRNGQNQCVECEEDNDCAPGYQCSPDNQCFECNKDEDCERGEYCDLEVGQCEVCDSSAQCAGSSCNCCPVGSNGLQMQCVPVDADGPPVCVECVNDGDCPEGVCEPTTGHCVSALEPNRDPAACGPDRQACPDARPFCLPGPLGAACLECRWDPDCPEGEYCNSGLCDTCNQDRHCGPRCDACAGDTPFCQGGDTADSSQCVGCTDDDQCAGGACDPTTNTCTTACVQSCGEGLLCFDNVCVECYADAHCACGGSCDLDSFTCDSSCKSNKDCLGNEHCQLTSDGSTECAAGPLPSDVLCARPLTLGCESRVGRGPASSPWAAALLALGALLWTRRRARRSAR
ncbi:outer membrane exchange protein TraA family protein [Haliangium ochraceum]|uniref:TraA n=2 Tax=Haliangium ochraceum TaxID=80816 RepID=D0LM76_HALO1|nr:outer membrane exchange protein TraA family protein [Haliangium ochraceum]ACY16782.1 conserved hypothetical protein [Haliangium ochraceum DSM 14365]QAT78155.1 TraA [Haliangium ochraceum]